MTLLAAAGWYGWGYWTVGQYLVSTDDAYVKADNTTVAPKVSGYLHEVLVEYHVGDALIQSLGFPPGNQAIAENGDVVTIICSLRLVDSGPPRPR